MNYKCIRKCTFKSRYWEPDQVCDFGKEAVPYHFVVTDEEANTEYPKPRVDIMSAKPIGVNAKTFYEISKSGANTNVGFASSLQKDEVYHNPRQLKVKK